MNTIINKYLNFYITRQTSLLAILLIGLEITITIFFVIVENIEFEFPETFTYIFYGLDVLDVLAATYILFYLKNFLSQVMYQKGFDILFILLLIAFLVNSVFNILFPFIDFLSIHNLIGGLIFILNVWLLVKFFKLPYSPFRKYLRWYICLIFISVVISVSLIPIVLLMAKNGIINNEDGMFVSKIIFKIMPLTRLLAVLFMIIYYLTSIKKLDSSNS